MQLRSSRSRRALPSSILQRGAAPIFGLGLALVFVTQSLVSCGSDDDAKCTVGEEKPCANPSCDDDLGAQVCRDDGTFSDCSCDPLGAGGSSMAGAAGNGPLGGAGGTTGQAAQALVGLPCAVDADCQGGLTCVPSTANGPFQNGGPQNGYCTKPCTASADCEAVDEFADCLRIDNGGTPDDTSDDTRICVELCLSDDPMSDTEAKCHLLTGMRTNLACLAQTPPPSGRTRSVGFCVPFCHSDAGCGNGRFCDLSTGVCVDQAPSGAAIGALCAEDTECASGFCAQFADGTSFCSGFCTFGAIGGCGFEANAPAGTREAACLDPFPFAQGVPIGVGDVGACTELCDTATDCAQAGWTCEAFETRGFPQNAIDGWGRFGFCNPPGATPAGGDAG